MNLAEFRIGMPVAGNSELRKDVIELTPCGLVKNSVISFLTDDNCFHYIIIMCGVFFFFSLSK